MVQAGSVGATLVYTYNANGLRVAQSVDGSVTNFVWDWASGIPEMLSEGDNIYLVGHETLGQWDDASPGGAEEWTYYLPDALGSIRQTTDEAGSVTASREWTPFGVEVALSGAEGVGTAQSGLGYTGERYDTCAQMVYLCARWFDGYSERRIGKYSYSIE